jgi:hypothetical protein
MKSTLAEFINTLTEIANRKRRGNRAWSIDLKYFKPKE